MPYPTLSPDLDVTVEGLHVCLMHRDSGDFKLFTPLASAILAFADGNRTSNEIADAVITLYEAEDDVVLRHSILALIADLIKKKVLFIEDNR